MRFKKGSNWKGKIFSCLIVAAFFGSIYIFSPNNASAVMVNITGLAEGYDQGMQIEIITDIFIEDGERIPIDYIELALAGPMFLNTTYEVNGTPISSPPWVSITLLSIQGQDPGYGYGYGYNDYYNYDYGYRYGYDHDDEYAYDFGYGYGYIGRLKYKISIDSSFLLIGNYTMQLHVFTGSGVHQRFSSDIRPFAVWPVGESGKSWPQFQNNPAHSGFSVSKAPDYEYLVWNNFSQGGLRTPVISEGKIILSGRQYDRVYCYDENTGELLWQHDTSNSVCPVPAISQNKVFFSTCWYNTTAGGWYGSLNCINLNNGSLEWISLKDSDATIRSHSITAADGRIFVSDRSHLYCLNEDSGNILWKFQEPNIEEYSPTIINGNVYITYYLGAMDTVLTCIDEISGMEKWEKSYGWDWSLTALSAIENSIYYGANDWSGNHMLVCTNATTGVTLWELPTQQRIDNSPALAYGNVYLLNQEYNATAGETKGVLNCVDGSNGTMKWKYETSGWAYFTGSPVIADRKVYFGDDWGRFYCVDANNGSLIWNSTTWGLELYTPSIANGKVIVADNSLLYCYSLDKYAPEHSNEYPPISGRTKLPQPTISVDVTDQSGVVESSIRLKVDGVSVFYEKLLITDGYEIWYIPATPYVDGQAVTVQIIAEDVYGNELDFTWWFIVDLTPPEVVSHSPDGTDIPVGTDIRVEFSEEMNKETAEFAFSISPYVPGNFSWNGNTMVYTPDTPLQYNTEYTALVHWWALDIAGNFLVSDYSWNFTTEIPELDPPEHSNEFPAIGGYTTDPKPTVSVWVTDNSSVDQSSIRLYVDGTSVFYDLQPVTDGFNVSYYCEAGLESYTTVDCRIIADDIYGNHLDFNWWFYVNTTTYYEIPLQQGWNLISIPLIPYNDSIEAVLSSIAGKWDYAQSYDSSSPGDPWKTYNIYGPSSLNELMTINNRMAFWLHVNDIGVTLNVTGGAPVWTSMILKAGWNLVGYPTLNNTETVVNALWGTGADKVMVGDTSEPYHIKEVGPTYIMKPGEGYWIHVVADTVWVIDW